MTDALFDLPAGAVAEKLSTGRRLTIRQATDLARGRHPLTGDRLHPEAAPHDDRKAPGRRCGNCWYRGPSSGEHAGSFPKCWYGYQTPTNTEKFATAPRITGGPATDVRAWWPACPDHTWTDPTVSPDAARHPGGTP